MANAKSKVVRKPSVKPVNAEKVRQQDLAKCAFALANAHNGEDAAADAVSAARLAFYNLVGQTYGSNWFEKKETSLAPRAIFYRAHFETKDLKVTVDVNTARGEMKSTPIEGADTKAVKKEADNAKSRFNKFIAWCEDEKAGKHVEKDPNNRQSKTKGKRTLTEIVKDSGQRIYNALYKEGNKTACAALQTWATTHAKGVKVAVPAGSK